MGLDTITPASMAHLFNTGSSVFHQHGGIATRVDYEKYHVMDIETFKKEVVPTLGKENQNLITVRDSVSGQFVRLLKDEAVVYETTSVRDVPLVKLEEQLHTKSAFTLLLDSPFQVLCYIQKKDGTKHITVRIPERPFVMNLTHDMAEATGFHEPQTIWHPPVWMHVCMTMNNTWTGGYALAAPDICRDPLDTELFSLGLPHTYDNGHVCWGDARLKDVATEDKPTEGTTIQMLYQMLFNSNFSDHTVPQTANIEKTAEVYKSLPRIDYYDDLIKHAHSTGRGDGMSGIKKEYAIYVIQLQRIWKDKGGWAKYPFIPYRPDGCYTQNNREKVKRFMELDFNEN